MSDNTLISVVTISFNQAKFLPAALKSIHSQAGPIEHIVVDPGSTDESRRIVDAASEDIIKIYESDRGPADGLNKGFARATGEIFYFLNADDVVAPGAFEFARNFFDKNPKVDVLYGAGHIINEHDQPIRFIRATHFSCRTYLNDSTNILQQSFFFRRAAFEKIGGFNVNNRVSWDGELFFRMKMSGLTFLAIFSPFGGFRVYGGTITSTQGHQQKRQIVRAALAQEYLGRQISLSEKKLKFVWMLEKQISSLLIYLRTILLYRRELEKSGLAIPPVESLVRTKYVGGYKG